ncbi:site-specific tyrosine recombinase XerD [Rothia sp. ZJ932]|uniref:site-specific tyrosine recombinase XerD n=1 Tax=Rothia sp. ZJ932 TaxID=2810516 RepID=UPI0019688364|nr:site-specific tyrosine recombinase XerD [Rothia sp. ZJ932]QRZ60997.1 site-specific tyrosine recombinase XerD [Rothia sp. ZJ932]
MSRPTASALTQAEEKPLTPLGRSVQKYLSHLVIERGLATNTVDSYTRDLNRYEHYLAEQGVIDAHRITTKHIRDFAVSLATGNVEVKPLSTRSIARVLVAVRGAHKFWLIEGITTTDAAATVAPPTPAQRLPKAISLERVQKLLEAPDSSTATGLRDRAILEFLYSTGARISEVTNVDLDDLSRTRATANSSQDAEATEPLATQVPAVVRLFGKGNKERIVPVGSYALKAIDDYLVRARPELAAKGKGTPALFVNARGSRLTRQGAWLILKKACDRAQLAEEISPHTLRHSYATHLLEGGADIRVVQELLGHASVNTTQIYTKVTAHTLREVFAAAHPRAR